MSSVKWFKVHAVSVILSVVEGSIHKTIVEMFRLLDPSTP